MRIDSVFLRAVKVTLAWPVVMGRDLGRGDLEAFGNPHGSCSKIIPLCFVVCLHRVAAAAVALGHRLSQLQTLNKIQNSKKAENVLFSPLSCEGQAVLSLMSMYPDSLLLRIYYIRDR